MRESPDKGGGFVPGLPSRGGAVAFAVNGALLHCSNSNINVKSCDAKAALSRSARRGKKVASRTPSSLLHHSYVAEYRGVNAGDKRRKRARARGEGGGEALCMMATHQGGVLDHEVMTGLTSRITAFEMEGE